MPYNFSFSFVDIDQENDIDSALQRNMSNDYVYTETVPWQRVLSDFVSFLANVYGYSLSKSVAVVDDPDTGDYTTMHDINV